MKIKVGNTFLYLHLLNVFKLLFAFVYSQPIFFWHICELAYFILPQFFLY